MTIPDEQTQEVNFCNATSVSVKIHYVKPMGVKFEIPEDALEMAKDLDEVA